MYMLPRDNHCITPTPSCGTSSVVPAANPDWLNPVHDGPSFASSPLVSADSSSSSMAPMTTPAMEITATPNTSLEGFAQPGSVPGDVGLLYRRLGRHLSLPIQNFVPKRECPANDDSDSNDSDGDEEMRDAPRAKPKVRGKWKAVPPPLSSQEEDAKPMAAAAVVVSEVKQRNDTDDCKRAEMLTYEKAAAEWERSLLESPRLLPTPNGVKQLIDLGVPAHHCSVEDAVEDSENAKKGCSEDDAYLVDSLFLGPTPCPRKKPKFTYDHLSGVMKYKTSSFASSSSAAAMAAAAAATAAAAAATRAAEAAEAAAAVSTTLNMRAPMSPPAALGLAVSAPLTPFITSPAVVKASPWSIAGMTPSSHRPHHSDFL